jgi:hypothetical protein
MRLIDRKHIANSPCMCILPHGAFSSFSRNYLGAFGGLKICTIIRKIPGISIFGMYSAAWNVLAVEAPEYSSEILGSVFISNLSHGGMYFSRYGQHDRALVNLNGAAWQTAGLAPALLIRSNALTLIMR